MATRGAAVDLVGLVKQFGDTAAVDDVTLSITGGEFFSLLGPSGCGKTTTLRLIAGFEQPTSGQILLDGVDMAATAPHKRPVNTVFQSYALFPHLSVEDNVAYGLRWQSGVAQGRSAATSRRRVGSRATRRLREAQARATVRRSAAAGRAARARLILEPEVLLLDEPLGALRREAAQGPPGRADHRAP